MQIIVAGNSRIVFRSSRSSIWIKDLLLHINPRNLRMGKVLHLFSFHENVHTKTVQRFGMLALCSAILTKHFAIQFLSVSHMFRTVPGLF